MYGYYDAARSIAYFLLQDYERALGFAEKATRRPVMVAFWPYTLMASALARLGRLEEAASAMAEAQRRNPDLSLEFVRSATWWSHDHLDALFEGLVAAGLPETGNMAGDA